MRPWLSGRASWPPHHRPSSPFEISAPIPYFIADGKGKTGFRATDTGLARWALEDWQRSSGQAIRFEPAPESSALVRLYWAEPSESQYGEMETIVVGGRLGAAVYIRPEMGSLGPDIAERASRDPLLRETIVYLTCVHELGHALGLRHTREYRDIMYSVTARPGKPATLQVRTSA